MISIKSLLALVVVLSVVASFASAFEPKITHKVFFDVQVDGKDAGRIGKIVIS